MTWPRWTLLAGLLFGGMAAGNRLPQAPTDAVVVNEAPLDTNLVPAQQYQCLPQYEVWNMSYGPADTVSATWMQDDSLGGCTFYLQRSQGINSLVGGL